MKQDTWPAAIMQRKRAFRTERYDTYFISTHIYLRLMRICQPKEVEIDDIVRKEHAAVYAFGFSQSPDETISLGLKSSCVLLFPYHVMATAFINA